ncbi:MAG: DUF4365 domain-containing protein [Thermoleophilia bacterium]
MGVTDPQARQGIALANYAFAFEVGWFFRELPDPDYGVDAQAEEPDASGRPSGRLLGIQIKGGRTWFERPSADGRFWRVGVKKQNVAYWRNYALPVIFVICDLDRRSAYWAHITESNLRAAGTAFELQIPKANLLDASASQWLSALVARASTRTDEEQVRQRVALDGEWISMLAAGERLFVEAEEHLDQSSRPPSVHLVAEDGAVRRDWPVTLVPGRDLAEALREVFPWARLENDRAASVDPGSVSSPGPPSVGPFEKDDEVARWRLELHLNQVGKKFVQEGRPSDEELDEALSELELEVARAEERKTAEYFGDIIDVPVGRLMERVVYLPEDKALEMPIGADEVLWSDPDDRFPVAAVLLAHATRREPSQALAEAFLARFGHVFDDNGQGWTLPCRDIDDWLDDLGVARS